MKTTRSILRFLPVIFWMGLIYFLSSRPDLPKAESFLWEFLFKKSGHIFVYFILTFIWFYTLTKNRITNSIIYTYAYAFTDEIHQLFVPGRTGMLRDVYIDFIGIILAVLLFVLLKVWKKPSSPALAKRLKK